MRAATSVLSLSVLVPLASLSAQEPPLIEPNARVRVTAPGIGVQMSVGTYLSRADGVMLLAPQSRAGPSTIPLASMTALDVSWGRVSSAGKGALWGAFAGAFLGGALGALGAGAGTEDCWEHSSNPCTVWFATIWAVALGVPALVVGTVAGTLIKTDRWQEVPLDQLRLGSVPQPDGRYGLGLSVTF
jgi:hypothetical protein